MRKKPTKDEIDSRILKSGVDAYTEDTYVRADIPMEFHCSKGHTWKTKLGNITHNHQGCPYCSGRYPVIGQNDLWTVYPEIAQLLLDKDIGYYITPHSGKRMGFKCPNCGHISEHIVANVINRGFSCPVCSDGISYPNKFAASMLTQLEVEYFPEFYLNGASYRYDFYLPKHNIIIEMNGRQHYEEWTRNKRSLLEEQENDKNKKDFAISNGIKYYIVIDSRISDINYISFNILKSELSNIFDLSIINWRECGYYASGSLVVETANLYNSGMNVQKISEKIKYSTASVRNFLEKATNIGLCNWVKEKGFLNEKHPVILLNTKEIFSSISDGNRKYDVGVANISANCLRKRNYAGTSPINGDPLVWRYLEDYNENEIIDFKSLINPRAIKNFLTV